MNRFILYLYFIYLFISLFICLFIYVLVFSLHLFVNLGDGQNTDPQSMDYPNGLPKWTTLKWTTSKNTISEYILTLHDLHGLQPPL